MIELAPLEADDRTGEDGVRTLDVNLRPNPIADAIAAAKAHNRRTRLSGTTDEIILDHLANGPLDRTRRASSVPNITSDTALKTHDSVERAATAGCA